MPRDFWTNEATKLVAPGLIKVTDAMKKPLETALLGAVSI
jgi:hypothetical protein